MKLAGMLKGWSVFHIFSFLLAFGSFLSSQTIIAVIDFEAKGISAIEASALTDRLGAELFALGRFTLIEREQMGEILEEQGFQLTGCVAAECAVEVGKMLGAEQTIVGSISKVGEVFSVSARVIDVESGKILQMTVYDYEGDIGGLLKRGMRNVAAKLIMERTMAATAAIIRHGALSVNTLPPGATVWIDDEKLEGLTPLLAEDQPAGERTIYAEKGGYSASTVVEIEPDAITQIDLTLEMGRSSLYVFSTPLGAEVFIDGEKYGVTPVTAEDLTTDRHQLMVKKSDYVDYSEQVLIEKEKVNKIDVTLGKLPVLSIMSEPSGALIKTFGRYKGGRTPAKGIVLEPGNYTVTLTKPDYDDNIQKVSLKPNDNIELVAKLKKFPVLSIMSEPSGALIKTFGRYKGGRTPAKEIVLEPGSYTVILTRRNFEDYVEEVSLKPNDSVEITAKLIRETGSLQVQTTPSAASIMMQDQKGNTVNNGTSPTTFQNVPSGPYVLLVEAQDYLSVERNIEVSYGELTKASVDLRSISSMQNKIKSLKLKRNYFLAAAGTLAGAGGLLKYSANKHYEDYSRASNNATDLHKRVDTEDRLNPFAFGLGAVCAVPFAYYQARVLILQKLLKKGSIKE